NSVGPIGISQIGGPGHFMSGRIISFVMHGNNTDILYCGGASGGLWKSSNGGNNWFNLMDPLSCPSVSSIAVSYLSADNTIWFSTGSGFNGDGPQIGRVYKSTNGGNSWINISSLPSTLSWISKIEINVFNNNVVYIGTNNGLYRSTNAGGNFTQVISGQISDVITYTNLFLPDEINVVVSVINAGSFTGIKRSTNGGLNFSSTTLPSFNPSQCGRITLARDPGTSKTFALMANVNGSFLGLWNSTDKGGTWTMRTLPSAGGQSGYNQGLAVAPNG